ncbi:MAG TPA: AarF/UbiB family protein [Longimicrobiales bacterium]|nr:AarF/UbiB family protein [Longimicrobiales bacterium]
MSLSLKAKHIGRYGDLARLLVKYGRHDLVEGTSLADALPRDERQRHGDSDDIDPAADALADDLEKLGPTYIKLGQLLSTRADILPPAYMEALSRLQDRVEPFPAAEAERIVEDELGARISKLFAEFQLEPIAAASLGQVHRAQLRDGRDVAVKVQRPHIRERIVEDLEALNELAMFIDAHTELGRRYGMAGMLEEFRHSLMRELDYTREAQNLTVFRTNMREFDRLVVPAPIADYTTARVLTMEWVHGSKITDLAPVRRIELDGEALGETLFQAYLRQILVDGIFHADPHPGNVFLTNDDRIALIDLGMVGYVAESMQEKLLKLLIAISEGKGEDAAEVAASMGQRLEGFNRQQYTREIANLVAMHRDSTVGNLDIGRVLVEITRISGDNGVRQPAELTMLGKTLLNLDRVAITLAPDFNVNDAIRRNVVSLMQRRMLKQFSPTHAISAALELNEFVQQLPSRLNRMMDRIADNQIRVKVDAIDEAEVISGMQKIANRITTGLIVAALIIGAAMLMQIETRFTIFGYPGFAILLFAGAVACGVWLLYDILFHDRQAPKR